MAIGARIIGSRTIGDGTLGSIAAAGGGGGGGTATSVLLVHRGPRRARRALVRDKGKFFFHRKPVRGGVRYVSAPSALIPIIADDPSVLTFPAGGNSGGYQVIVVDKFGTRVSFGELAKAELQSFDWILNNAGSATFTINTLDSHATAVSGLDREVQIWRNGRLLWWGPIVRPDATSKRIDTQCRQLEWYFDRIHFGRADRSNLLTNPSFETGDLTGWTTVNTTPVVTQSIYVDGAYSVRLEQSTAQQDAYLEQQLDDYVATGVGSVLVLAAWFWIDPDAWLGEAIGSRGLTLRRLHATTNAVLQSGVVDIEGDTPRGTWQRVETLVNMPPDAVEDIEVRLYSPGGVIHWDALSLTLMESISSVSSPTDFTSDLADLFTLMVQHAQDPSFQKNDKNIGVDAPISGIRVERHFQLAEHANVGESIRQFTEEGLCDWSVEITPSTRTATLHVPTKGERKPEFKIYLYGNETEGTTKANIADDFRLSFDGEQAVSSVVVLGPGDGPDREEGGAVDNAVFGGNIYEAVIASPPEATINSLDAVANEQLSVMKSPYVLRATYLPLVRPGDPNYLVARDPIDSLHVGDTVPVVLDYGWIQADADYRVVQKSVDAQRDLCTVTLNQVPS